MEITSTDPEFAASLHAFADEVQQTLTLSHHDRVLVRLGAAIAVGSQDTFRTVLVAALDEDAVTPAEVKEVVYQAVAYVGAARTTAFLATANEILSERGVALPLPDQGTNDPATRAERGLAAQKTIVGADRVDAMYAAAPTDTAHFQRFLSANCFGDAVARTGLSLRTRELLTFAMLVALGGADAQVRAHVAGNLSVGNGRQDLIDVLTVLVQDIGYPRTLNGLAAVDDAAPAAPAESATTTKEHA